MDPTLSEIRIFAGNFAPLSWAFCNGALMSIAENTALFSLLGTTYGGDGQTTFALPDLRGRAAIGTGQGPGLSYYDLGQVSGTNAVTLIVTNLAAHNHTAVLKAAATATTGNPAGAYPAAGNGSTSDGNSILMASFADTTDNSHFAPGVITVGIAGSNQPVSVTNPYLGLNFIIAVEGIYPSRN